MLVNELIVDDGCGQKTLTWLRLGRFFILVYPRLVAFLHFFRANHAALAENISVFLAGDFFGHFKDHLDQSIHRQLLWTPKEDSSLAEIFNRTFEPRAGVIHAVTKREVEFEAARSRRPRWPLLSGVAAPDESFRIGMRDALGAAHGGPVIFVFRRAQQANLVIVAVRTAARPGELVGATPEHKHIHNLLRHDGYVRTLGAPEGSSSLEEESLNRLLSCRLVARTCSNPRVINGALTNNLA
jgi:hypothetical protein